jgi:8-oxo-dGTP pyrophosphatase MutT (NUDIX family)
MHLNITARKINLRITTRSVINNKTHLLMAWYAKEKFFSLPDGGLGEGESIKACLKRELQEELGIDAEVGALLGCLEEHYIYKRQAYQESCFLFRVDSLKKTFR